DNGNVTIKDLWLKKVWQITRSMDGWAINLQVKKGVVHKIRPGVWYSINKKNMPMFECLEDFVSAIEETVYQNPATRHNASLWKKKFEEAYKKHYNRSISIPRWHEIAHKYKKK
ncbi:NgoBV family restriction endonuclease, partial [Neisseria gonorrhoeae]